MASHDYQDSRVHIPAILNRGRSDNPIRTQNNEITMHRYVQLAHIYFEVQENAPAFRITIGCKTTAVGQGLGYGRTERWS